MQGPGVEADCCLLDLLGAEVTYMNMTAYNKGRLQSSFWIVDKQHVYIGSAGLDWRSLGQVIDPPYLNSGPVVHQNEPPESTQILTAFLKYWMPRTEFHVVYTTEAHFSIDCVLGLAAWF